MGCSRVWGKICNLSQQKGKVAEFVEANVKINVGRGDKTKFWHNHWVDGESLKVSFPGLFAISAQKTALISHVHVWDGVEWRWSLLWKRSLQGVEFEWFRELMVKINGAVGNGEREDGLEWKCVDMGGYSTKTFQLLAIRAGGVVEDPRMKAFWKGYAAPKVELFMWFAIQRKISTREELARRHIISGDEVGCPWCEACLESVEHLFVCCCKAKACWERLLSWWGIEWVVPLSMESVFDQDGGGVVCGKRRKRVWLSSIFYLAWGMWEARNRKIFENKSCTVDEIMSKLKIAVWHWTRSWWKNFLVAAAQFCASSCLAELVDR